MTLHDDASRVLPSGLMQRLLGAYYTPHSVAEYLAEWTLRRDGEFILEPSFGDGIFLNAVTASAARRQLSEVTLYGAEIDPCALAAAVETETITPEHAYCGDFLSLSPFPVQAVIGNPPYVRLRHLPADQRDRALDAARAVLDQGMEPSGSVWLPFLLHATRFLALGGRLAFVLPYEATYVRYARPLWSALGQRFGSLRVLRTHERLFPEIYQDVVLLLADDYGAHTSGVDYQAFERISDLLANRPVIDTPLAITDLTRGERAFISALLSAELRALLTERIAALTAPAREQVVFNIGYVSGDKAFFHPDAATVAKYNLPAASLRPAITSARALRGAGLYTSAAPDRATETLFLPNPIALTDGDRRYVALGEELGVTLRYKCRVRRPWYVTPDTRVPDMLLSVFSERPVLLMNDGGHLASNSLLCGFVRSTSTSEQLATAWYTSLTLLQCELEVHALGGGVMVLIPGEAGNIRLPQRVEAPVGHLAQLDQQLRAGKVASAYRAGDRAVLMTQLRFTRHEIALIRHGIAVLAHWRTSARSSLT